MKRFNLMDVQEGVSDLPPWSGPGRMLVHERGLDQRLSFLHPPHTRLDEGLEEAKERKLFSVSGDLRFDPPSNPPHLLTAPELPDNDLAGLLAQI